ncbi:MAG: beta-N-acetylglucosaminidase domain-containing protein [Kiritimatiellia bacterium]
MRFLLIVGIVLTSVCVQADVLPETMRVYPTPQEISLNGTLSFPSPKCVTLERSSAFDEDAARLLTNTFKFSDTAAFRITWRVDSALPKEGYTLTLHEKGAAFVASTGVGFFYASQTLKQLLATATFQAVTIKDFPTVPFRGTVEGFYGQPWSFEARKSQFRFYGDCKLNTYIYGPKDDPYHGFSNQWREPYPAAEAQKMAALVKVAHENKVNFVWAVHPGRDIQWKDDSDMKACVAKFEKMYALGVRSFAVFFDDIGGEGARADKQVELLNYVNRTFVRTHKDVTPLLLCPTQYNKSWSGGPYLETLGKGLDSDIMVMWTGNSVCCDITKETMTWINAKISRKAYIWWNWPVSDYVRSHLLLGRAYGNDLQNGNLYAGFVSNPMDKPEASKIALFGVANYTWNPSVFASEQTWRDGIKQLFPTCSAEVQTFASHNSDQGPNGHGMRREESIVVEPITSRVISALKSNQVPSSADLQTLHQAFAEMIPSGRTVASAKACQNELFAEEVAAWGEAFTQLGIAGTALCDALDGKKSEADALTTLLACRAEQRSISARHASRPFQTDVVVASRVMTPFVNFCAETLYSKLYQKITGRNVPLNGAPSIYQFITNVDAMKKLQVRRDKTFVQLPQIFEPKTLQSGEWIGILLPEGVTATWVHFSLDNVAVAQQGKIELSKDGKTWFTRSMVAQNGELEIRNINAQEGIMAARYINSSDRPITITLKRFKLDVPAGANANVAATMTDGIFDSGYALAKGETVRIPLAHPIRKENTCVLASGAFAIDYQKDAILIKAESTGVTIYEVIH